MKEGRMEGRKKGGHDDGSDVCQKIIATPSLSLSLYIYIYIERDV
jgi:hypothetical protein